MRIIDLTTLTRLFGMAETDVLRWIADFEEHFSSTSKGTNGQDRSFIDADLCVLLYIQHETEGGKCPDEIESGLCSREHLSDMFVDEACLHSPLFQDVPEEIDETWRHGVLIGGMAGRDWVQVARSYKQAADNLVAAAMKSDELYECDYPIFYLYRHCIELYLKTILGGKVRGHDFSKLLKALEGKYQKTLCGWIRERLWDFHEVDERSDMFRYPEDIKDGELWIDFHHLRLVMDHITQAFEQHIAGQLSK
jgi:hypothetical protein